MDRVRIDDDLKEFLTHPRMMIVGTTNRERRPAIARAVGLDIEPGAESAVLFISQWQWPETIENIRNTGRMAATVVDAATYVSFQMKGRAELREPTEADRDRAARYIATMSQELRRLGVPDALMLPWLTDRKIAVATLAIEEVYVQTPGPSAGMIAGAIA